MFVTIPFIIQIQNHHQLKFNYGKNGDFLKRNI